MAWPVAMVMCHTNKTLFFNNAFSKMRRATVTAIFLHRVKWFLLPIACGIDHCLKVIIIHQRTNTVWGVFSLKHNLKGVNYFYFQE